MCQHPKQETKKGVKIEHLHPFPLIAAQTTPQNGSSGARPSNGRLSCTLLQKHKPAWPALGPASGMQQSSQYCLACSWTSIKNAMVKSMQPGLLLDQHQECNGQVNTRWEEGCLHKGKLASAARGCTSQPGKRVSKVGFHMCSSRTIGGARGVTNRHLI